MNCPSELILMMYADGALAGEEHVTADTHVASCDGCRRQVQGLRAETGVISRALAAEPEVARVPPLDAPVPHGVMAAAAALALVAGTALAALPRLLAELPAPFSWFSPFDGWALADLFVRAAVFLVQQGDSLVRASSEMAAAAVLVGIAAWVAHGLRGRRPGPMLLVCLLGVVLVLPDAAHALDLRFQKDGTVLVPAGETIADTLVAAGETVEIAGDVEGDLIAVGRRVVIRGRVGGMLITGAASVTIEGEVAGSVIGFGRSLEVNAASIGRNLYGFGSTVTTAQRIEHDAVVFGQQVSLGGPVGGDVLGFAENLEVGNTVGGSLRAYAERVTLLAPARIAGDATVHVPDEDNFTLVPGAVVAGQITTDVSLVREHEQSRYASGGYYLGQVLRFAAALLTGVVLLALLPQLRRVSARTPVQALVATGAGLVAVVAMPVIAVLVAVTLIGLPVAIIALMLWLAGLYVAKILVAHVIGARLLEAAGRRRGFVVTLAVGLLAVIVVVNLPFIGGLISFLLTICGFGLLVLFLWDAIRREPAPAP